MFVEVSGKREFADFTKKAFLRSAVREKLSSKSLREFSETFLYKLVIKAFSKYLKK